MAHIICLTSGLSGILNASFELAARLEAAGHRITYGAPAPVAEAVRAQGFSFVQLPPILQSPEPEAPDFKGPLRKGRRWWYKQSHREKRRQEAYASLGVDQIITRLNSWSPDLLIIDVELHEYILAAYALKLPLVLLSQWFSLWKRPGLPYLLHDTIPGRGWAGRHWMIELSWWRIRIHRQWMFVKKKWVSGGTDRRTMLLEMARRLGFPEACIRDNYWPGPFTYRRLPVMSMTAWEMEFPHRKRDNLYYVGPMVYTARKDLRSDERIREQLQTLFKKKKSAGLRLIYCSVSSLKSGDRRFLKKVCEAVRNQEGWLLILSLGGLMETGFLDTLPPNVFPFSWVPQLEVLARADCSINHGGIHTINECIHFQVPMLVYSGKRSDQNGCAARVAYHKLGLSGDKDLDTAQTIRHKISLVLNKAEFRNNLTDIHGHYLRYQAEKHLEKLVCNFLKAENSLQKISK